MYVNLYPCTHPASTLYASSALTVGLHSSGYNSLAMARAAGADMTLAVRMWLMGAWNNDTRHRRSDLSMSKRLQNELRSSAWSIIFSRIQRCLADHCHVKFLFTGTFLVVLVAFLALSRQWECGGPDFRLHCVNPASSDSSCLRVNGTNMTAHTAVLKWNQRRLQSTHVRLVTNCLGLLIYLYSFKLLYSTQSKNKFLYLWYGRIQLLCLKSLS